MPALFKYIIDHFFTIFEVFGYVSGALFVCCLYCTGRSVFFPLLSKNNVYPTAVIQITIMMTQKIRNR